MICRRASDNPWPGVVGLGTGRRAWYRLIRCWCRWEASVHVGLGGRIEQPSPVGEILPL
jgi:hypothetical protein